MSNNIKQQTLLHAMMVAGVLVALNIAGRFAYTHLDLTEEKRYSLTEPSVKQLKSLDDVVHVEVLLEGKLPAGFKRMQNATRELLDDFSSRSDYFEYSFRNPLGGKPEDVQKTQKDLSQIGIYPVNLKVVDSDQKTEQLIYPYVIFHYKNRDVAVNLLENDVPGMPKEVVLNNSVSLLEYKFSNAIQKLRRIEKPRIGFLHGHGELHPSLTTDLRQTLRQFYEVGPVYLDSLAALPVDKLPVLVVSKPRGPFSDRDLFLLDQYMINGGSIFWMVEKLGASLDSMQGVNQRVPGEYQVNFDDLLFRNGVRVNNDLVLDLECGRIPMVVGQTGDAPQMELLPWFYFPVPTGRINHPIVKSLDRVWFQFPNSIDTVKTKTDIKKTVLLSSSSYSRLQMYPMNVDLSYASVAPDPALFNKKFIPLAVLLEGTFSSMFENRVTESMRAMLDQIKQPFQAQSVKPGKMIVVADGDFIKNDVNLKDGQVMPAGYSRYDKYLYANRDFALNTIEYLLDDAGIIEARSKDVKLRLLDPGKVKENKLTWQTLNIAVPLVLVVLLSLLMQSLRRRRYARF